MSIFTDPGLKLNFVTDGRDAVLLEEIRYELGHKGSGNWLVVSEGFFTDGTSTPRLLWSLMPPWGSKLSKAAIVHDYLLFLLIGGVPYPGYGTRKKIDDEYAVALKAIGASRLQVATAWTGVRAWSLYRGGPTP